MPPQSARGSIVTIYNGGVHCILNGNIVFFALYLSAIIKIVVVVVVVITINKMITE